jgi:hypothetical protein
MYGPSGAEWLTFLALVAVVGGLFGVGCEHASGWVLHHVSVGLH